MKYTSDIEEGGAWQMGVCGDHNCQMCQRCTWKTNCKTRSLAKPLSAHQSDYSFSLVSLKQTKPQSSDIMHVQEWVHPMVLQLCQYTPSLLLMNLLNNMPGQKENPRQAHL